MTFKHTRPKTDKGDYIFSGRPLVTRAVYMNLQDEEIKSIIQQVRDYVKEQVAVDYCQRFENAKKEKVFCVDNFSRTELEEMRDSGRYTGSELAALNFYTITFDPNPDEPEADSCVELCA